LLIILIFFQVFVSFVHKISLQNFLVKTQDWYQEDFAERLANLTATSLELVLETSLQNQNMDEADARKVIQAFNIILSQQLLQHHIQEVCILLSNGGDIIAIDNGNVLFSYLFKNQRQVPPPDESHSQAIRMYKELEEQIVGSEQIYSILEGKQTFHVFVPFVPKGEYVGAVYMKNTPACNFITSGIISSYNETSLIFTALILFGLLAMFYISSYTVRERNEAQKLLYQERERQLKEHIHLQKEALFAKRIYHTHHKAEKVMGFIKEDLQALSVNNIEEIKYRVTKYANFISRVIYDMKWFDPPIQAIRNPIFRTDLNELIRFIVQHIFLRVSSTLEQYQFVLNFDENLPVVQINEFVVWEILEPLIQNSIDHAGDGKITITIETKYFPALQESKIIVSDNGKGIRSDLLIENDQGIKRLFLENISTKNENQKSSGYGCYIAYEIATQRCGWSLDANNLKEGGCQFIITIPHHLS
ncbi:MAG: ATP-binding protein, partial [candidate division KSB1 bacterium]|nr:ATP-binding protein [candidate division KSB1 bacterium]